MIKYRTQNDTDRDFLYKLYASTRTDEIKLTDWDNTQIELFLRFQFEAQLKHYLNNYKKATFEIITIQSKDAGRLYLNQDENEIRIIDISLLPEYRGKGFGSEIMGEILKNGEQLKKPVRLSVFINNPAQRFYKRLGFVKISDEPPYIQMEGTALLK
jgi:ribosomal protein S18 acetylase RimI-like enzyme